MSVDNTTLTEKQAFDRFVSLLLEQEATKEDIKYLSKSVKENEMDARTIKAAAKLYIKNALEEKQNEFERIKQVYEDNAN